MAAELRRCGRKGRRGGDAEEIEDDPGTEAAEEAKARLKTTQGIFFLSI
jgi:hypothetical protein